MWLAGGNKKCIKIIGGKSSDKLPLVRARRRLKDNKKGLRKMVFSE
jgi:hypothetical protein